MKTKPTIREEANAIVAYAFRNGCLEELHAGKVSRLLKDQSLSRITDPEMKKLMVESCERVAKLLERKETDSDEYWKLINWENDAYTRNWDK